MPDWPDVPTMEEAGYKGFKYNGFVGLAAPAKTPPEIIALLNKAVNESIHTDEFKTRMAALGMTAPDAADNTQEKFKAFLQAEVRAKADLRSPCLQRTGNQAPGQAIKFALSFASAKLRQAPSAGRPAI